MPASMAGAVICIGTSLTTTSLPVSRTSSAPASRAVPICVKLHRATCERRLPVPAFSSGQRLLTTLRGHLRARQTRRRAALAPMASAEQGSSSSQVVEHLVLFKLKEGTAPEAADAMLRELTALGHLWPPLDGILEVNCGEGLVTRSLLPTPEYTHALHVRARDRAALDAYSASPQHVAVVTDFVKPILADICAVDWEAEAAPAAEGSAAARVWHTVVMKLKDETTEEQQAAMVSGLRSHQGVIPGCLQVTIGPNFAPARAKGFTWGFLSTFPDAESLRLYSRNREHLKVMKDHVFPFVESFAAVDFVAWQPPEAKL